MELLRKRNSTQPAPDKKVLDRTLGLSSTTLLRWLLLTDITHTCFCGSGLEYTYRRIDPIEFFTYLSGILSRLQYLFTPQTIHGELQKLPQGTNLKNIAEV